MSKTVAEVYLFLKRGEGSILFPCKMLIDLDFFFV